MKLHSLITLTLLSGTAFCAAAQDSIRAPYQLQELEVTGVKRLPGSGIAPEAVSVISGAEARRLDISAPKQVGVVVPNFFMPEYGSRSTSAIYVRGLGARLEQPVVGLQVDNIPYLNKDSYDFEIGDIDRIEVLRGAQAVLNGRNTMGGQINIHTLSPLSTRGWRISAEYGSANLVKLSVGWYKTINPKLGTSLNFTGYHSDGFFWHDITKDYASLDNAGSLRWKTVWRPCQRVSVSNTAVLGKTRQFGYPYRSLNSKLIEYGDSCNYHRIGIADALTVSHAGKRCVVTSVTSVQLTDAQLDLDNDFMRERYFKLRQNTGEAILTEDFFARGVRGRYSWLAGAFAFYRSADNKAPVTFLQDGIEQLIVKHRNDANPQYPIRWDSNEFLLHSNYTQRSSGFALYHESGYSLGNWRFEAGARLDIERPEINYNLSTRTGYTVYNRETGLDTRHSNIDINMPGKLSRTFTELLPKATVSYINTPFTPYVTVSKGFKAGGYNTQMFSFVLEQALMADMGMSASHKVADIISYKPEESWNYEAGFHSKLFGNSLSVDGAAFFIDCRNQQLTVFPGGHATGRMMTNAGRTRSMGAELAARWTPVEDFAMQATYGFTDARFVKYLNGKEDFAGKFVPFAPKHTLFGMASYAPRCLSFKGIQPSLALNVRCAGPIFWDEANAVRQPFYALVGQEISFAAEKWVFTLWAKNLTNTQYDTFYFVSMSRAFAQRGVPRSFGASFRIKIL